MLENEVLDKDKDAARREELRVPSKDVLRASGQVQSLSRALKLLNALSYHAPGLSLSEVAQETASKGPGKGFAPWTSICSSASRWPRLSRAIEASRICSPWRRRW